MEVKLSFLKKASIATTPVLAADVGATKTNIGLFNIDATGIKPLRQETYLSNDFEELAQLVNHFTGGCSAASIACFAVAGPVFNDAVHITNLGWNIEKDVVETQCGIKQVHLLNDLEATAYGLAALKKEDIITLNEGGDIDGNIAIIAPGTGLGEAGLYWDGTAHHPFASEGGHEDFSARTDIDILLQKYLRQQYGHVSYERVLSGPGILDIFKFLAADMKREVSIALAKKIESEDPAAVITSSAMNNDEAITAETMSLFVKYLAYEACNLVLKFKATGGLYVCGGIAPKITSLISKETFLPNFFDCGRLSGVVKKVPVHIVLNNKTALLGAAHFAAYAC